MKTPCRLNKYLFPEYDKLDYCCGWHSPKSTLWVTTLEGKDKTFIQASDDRLDPIWVEIKDD